MNTVENLERYFLAYRTACEKYLLVSSEVEKQLKNSGILSAIQGRFLMLLQQCNDFSTAAFLLKHEHVVTKSSQLAIARCLLDAIVRVEYYRCYGIIADINTFYSDAESSKKRFELLIKKGYVPNQTEAQHYKSNNEHLKTSKDTLKAKDLKTADMFWHVQQKIRSEKRAFDANTLYIVYRDLSAAAHSDLIFLSDKHLNGKSIDQSELYKFLTDLLTEFAASLEIFLDQQCFFPKE